MSSELSASVRAALETYANVHRGSGHHSVVSTYLYEQARGIVLDHLGLDRDRHTVIFCSPRQADQLQARLGQDSCHSLSSRDIGLPLGLRAIAVLRHVLPAGAPLQSGGGTARLIAPGWVVSGWGPRQVRGRHPRDRQRHRLRQSFSNWAGTPSVTRRSRSGRPRTFCVMTGWRITPVSSCWSS